MACLSWAVKSIKGLAAYQLTPQDDMYYDHGLLMSQSIEIHHMMAGDVNLQLRLEDAVFTAFVDQGIRGVDLVETRERGLTEKSQTLIKQLETVKQSAYRKRGENPPTIEYGILPTPIIQFSNDPVPIDIPPSTQENS